VVDVDGSRRPGEHDRRRIRTARWLLVFGVVLGVVVAAGLAVAGGSGAAGLVVLLLGVMVGCVLTAAHLAVFALVDEIRNRPVATRRPVEALAYFLLALLLMLFVMGAASAVGGGGADDSGPIGADRPTGAHA
jgi:4-amino-4-deoxy-L-arabinose transferase-like glycosyltransferase